MKGWKKIALKFRLPVLLLVAFALLMVAISGSSSGAPANAPSLLIDLTPTGAILSDDQLGLGPRMVFSTVASRPLAAHELELHNATGLPLEITGVSSNSDDFQLDQSQQVPYWMGVGAIYDISVAYAPETVGLSAGTISVTFGSLPTAKINLGGLNSQDFEGSNEPNLQQIFAAVGYTDDVDMPAKPPSDINIPKSDKANSISNSHAAIGDEVLVHAFTQVSQSTPVRLTPIASYVTRSKSKFGPFGINQAGTKNTQPLLSFKGGTDDFGGQNQQLMPTASVSFTPKFTTFGIWDGSRGDFSEDALNPANAHEWRIYPAKDASGHVIPFTYLLADDAGLPSYANYDYQDAVFVISNVTPVQ